MRQQWWRWTTVASAALAAAAVVGVAVGVPALVRDQVQPARTVYSASWVALSPPPTSPRKGSIAAWTGTEALFLGGVTGGLCPPGASCVEPEQTARDGAAYDPVARTWRQTAPAPVDLPAYARPPVVGDAVYLLVDGRLLVYDASDDAWTRRPGPPDPAGPWSLSEAEADGRVLAVRSAQRGRYAPDQVYDAETQAWTPLSRDPLVPMMSRTLTATSHGLVLTGQPEVDQPGTDLATSVVRAALLEPGSATWRRLPDSDQLAAAFTWTGRRLVAPLLGGVDGGEVNGFGRTVPLGGTLDPGAGTWGRLPDTPAEGTGGWGVYATGGPRIATSGWLYDDQAATWSRLPRPQGAPESAGSAVWAGDRLVVLGGYTPDPAYSDAGLTKAAFLYTP